MSSIRSDIASYNYAVPAVFLAAKTVVFRFPTTSGKPMLPPTSSCSTSHLEKRVVTPRPGDEEKFGAVVGKVMASGFKTLLSVESPLAVASSAPVSPLNEEWDDFICYQDSYIREKARRGDPVPRHLGLIEESTEAATGLSSSVKSTFSLYGMREDARVDRSVVVNCRAMHKYKDAVDSDSDDDNDETDEKAEFGSFLHYSPTTPVSIPRTYNSRNVRTVASRGQRRKTVARVSFSEHESEWEDAEEEEEDATTTTDQFEWEKDTLAGSVGESREVGRREMPSALKVETADMGGSVSASENEHEATTPVVERAEFLVAPAIRRQSSFVTTSSSSSGRAPSRLLIGKSPVAAAPSLSTTEPLMDAVARRR